MKTNWRAVLGAVLLMLAGAALALATEHALVLQHRRSASDLPSHDAILNALDKQLNLTPAQHDSVDVVLTRHQAEIDSAWRQIHSQLRVSMDSVHREIGRVLTEEQVRQFHQWLRGQRVHLGH